MNASKRRAPAYGNNCSGTEKILCMLLRSTEQEHCREPREPILPTNTKYLKWFSLRKRHEHDEVQKSSLST
jgi:hypothetical protein